MALKPKPSPVEAGVPGRDVLEPHRSRRFPVQVRHWPDAPSGSAAFASSGFSVVVADFTACWERGEPTRVEDFLDRMEATHPADVVELIYREFCLAESLGMEPHPSDFLRRFPERQESLARLFRLHGALSSIDLQDCLDPEDLPQVGDEIGPYSLLRELGRGSFARVFLAEQSDLDDRLVVVKISTRLTPEPRLLARARHSHIVEVFWHGTAEDGALQLISMPFLGGASFAAVLGERRRLGRRPRKGRDLLADLDGVSAAEYPKANLTRAAREILQGLSYPAALAWIVARLAEALDHAFRKGVAHGDIKPSNILIAADGTPMLLDFNLAVSWRLPGGADLTADPGGTLAYMAPERLEAVADAHRQATPPRAGDRHRADIFALGVVLLEALTCREPALPQARARTRQEVADMLARSREQGGEAIRWLARSSVPPGLRPILARCLAADPADRYQRAAELAEDLDRWRTNKSPAYAAEPPRYARVARWARRRRALVTALALASLVGLVILLVGWLGFQASLRNQAEDKLALIWDRLDSGAFRYRMFGHWEPEQEGDSAENAKHQLDHYNVTNDARWRSRADVRALPEPERSELEAWLLEQVYRYATALGERPDSPGDWQRAVALLDGELQRVGFGAFETRRRVLARQLKRADSETHRPPVEAATPPHWMDEYLLGVEAEPRRISDARTHYLNALHDRPDSFWSHYRAAAADFRLGDHQAAAEHLRACIAQRPNNASLRVQLAACQFQLGQYDGALDATSKGLSIDPDNAMAMRNRTYVRGRLGQLDSAADDFRRFALLSHSPRKAFALSFHLDQLLPEGFVDALGGEDSPFFKRVDDDTGAEARILRAYQLRVAGRTDEALLELNRAIDLDADHLPARYFRASLLRQLRRDEARDDYAFLLEHPRLEELIPSYKEAVVIYLQRSGDHLYAGRIPDAVRVAHEGVVQANRFNSMRDEAHYTLARAYAASASASVASGGGSAQLLERIADELRSVRESHPEYLTNWFEKDQFFDKVRPRVRPLLMRRP